MPLPLTADRAALSCAPLVGNEAVGDEGLEHRGVTDRWGRLDPPSGGSNSGCDGSSPVPLVTSLHAEQTSAPQELSRRSTRLVELSKSTTERTRTNPHQRHRVAASGFADTTIQGVYKVTGALVPGACYVRDKA